jgi:hypothetical protein
VAVFDSENRDGVTVTDSSERNFGGLPIGRAARRRKMGNGPDSDAGKTVPPYIYSGKVKVLVAFFRNFCRCWKKISAGGPEIAGTPVLLRFSGNA